MLTQQYIKQLFNYDEQTGHFTRIVGRGSSHAGDLAGSVTWNGYVTIYLDKKNYRAHQLAWLYVYGEIPNTDIDHINRNRSDNRISNLRIASRSENNINSKLYSHNTSRFRGVSFSKERNKWESKIKHNGKTLHLGRFNSPEEAHQKYITEAKRIYGCFVP